MRKKHVKRIGIGCGGLIGLLIFIGIVGAITGQGNAQQAGATPTATSAAFVAANTPTQGITVQPTRTVVKPSPTVQPTHQITPIPTQRATPKPTPKPTQPACQAVNNNPWCYNFSPGNYIYSPPANFCAYFNCITSFSTGRGFVNECQDGTYSKSGGIQGDCSHHGGELQPLYSH